MQEADSHRAVRALHARYMQRCEEGTRELARWTTCLSRSLWCRRHNSSTHRISPRETTLFHCTERCIFHAFGNWFGLQAELTSATSIVSKDGAPIAEIAYDGAQTADPKTRFA